MCFLISRVRAIYLVFFLDDFFSQRKKKIREGKKRTLWLLFPWLTPLLPGTFLLGLSDLHISSSHGQIKFSSFFREKERKEKK